jgi:hypothetical protein
MPRPDTKPGEANGQARGQRDPAGRGLLAPAATYTRTARLAVLRQRASRRLPLFHAGDIIRFYGP